jgi:hypothetical protein
VRGVHYPHALAEWGLTCQMAGLLGLGRPPTGPEPSGLRPLGSRDVPALRPVSPGMASPEPQQAERPRGAKPGLRLWALSQVEAAEPPPCARPP